MNTNQAFQIKTLCNFKNQKYFSKCSSEKGGGVRALNKRLA